MSGHPEAVFLIFLAIFAAAIFLVVQGLRCLLSHKDMPTIMEPGGVFGLAQGKEHDSSST